MLITSPSFSDLMDCGRNVYSSYKRMLLVTIEFAAPITGHLMAWTWRLHTVHISHVRQYSEICSPCLNRLIITGHILWFHGRCKKRNNLDIKSAHDDKNVHVVQTIDVSKCRCSCYSVIGYGTRSNILYSAYIKPLVQSATQRNCYSLRLGTL